MADPLKAAAEQQRARLSPFERALSDVVAGGLTRFLGKPRFTPAQMRSLTAPGLSREPAGSSALKGDPTGRYIPGSMQTPFPASSTPIVSGIDSSGAVDRRQSDLYRQYAQTPEGQFERYFQSSEMDPYFGAASRGAGAPKDLQAALALAGQAKAPTDVPLSAYYRAQSAAGRGAMPEVVGGLTQGLEGEKAKAMEAWAKANPMLAYREFNKRQAAAPSMPMAPDQDIVMGDLGSRAQSEGGYTMEAFGQGVANPVPPTQAFNQGAVMDANRGIANLQPLQAAKTSGSAMPAFEPTDESLSKRIDAFLYGPGAK